MDGGRTVPTWFGVLGLLSGCIVDASEPCGKRFREADNGACLCPNGTEPIDGMCVPCGPHSEEQGGQCVCDEGYGRSGPGTDCEELVEPKPHLKDAGADGGAMPVCASSMDCPGDLLCDVHETEQCVDPPESLGGPCSSDADCSGQADFCELLSSGVCAIEGCDERQGRCPGDMVCCDYQILSRSFCVGLDDLEGGDCPAPGERVPRTGDSE